MRTKLIKWSVFCTTAGGGVLGRLRSSTLNPSSSELGRGVLELKLLSSECNFSAMLMKREASTPWRSLGVLALAVVLLTSKAAKQYSVYGSTDYHVLSIYFYGIKLGKMQPLQSGPEFRTWC